MSSPEKGLEASAERTDKLVERTPSSSQEQLENLKRFKRYFERPEPIDEGDGSYPVKVLTRFRGDSITIRPEEDAPPETPPAHEDGGDGADNGGDDPLAKLSGHELLVYRKAVEAEPVITADVRQVAAESDGSLAGLEQRLKRPDSVYEKLYEREGTRNLSIDRMHDIIRYTQLYAAERLASATNDSLELYRQRGYEIEKVANSWDDASNPYKGINAVLRNPDGQSFEVQFHTPESFDLKNGELHRLYEQYRILPRNSPERHRLSREARELSAALTRPAGIERVNNR